MKTTHEVLLRMAEDACVNVQFLDDGKVVSETTREVFDFALAAEVESYIATGDRWNHERVG